MDTLKNHPLRKLLGSLTEKSFYERLGWPDRHIIQYVSDLLVDFTDAQKASTIQNASGKGVEEVGEMLLEAEYGAVSGNMEREQKVHRHIGDYTLFMMGLFPEYLQNLKISRITTHPDALLDYTKVGKRSYGIVSELEGDSVFKKLSEHFELCVRGLGFVKSELAHLQELGPLQNPKIRLN